MTRPNGGFTGTGQDTGLHSGRTFGLQEPSAWQYLKYDDDDHPDVGDDDDGGGGEERWLIVKRGIRIMNKFPP